MTIDVEGLIAETNTDEVRVGRRVLVEGEILENVDSDGDVRVRIHTSDGNVDGYVEVCRVILLPDPPPSLPGTRVIAYGALWVCTEDGAWRKIAGPSRQPTANYVLWEALANAADLVVEPTLDQMADIQPLRYN